VCVYRNGWTISFSEIEQNEIKTSRNEERRNVKGIIGKCKLMTKNTHSELMAITEKNK
jgi:hypothetical protein